MKTKRRWIRDGKVLVFYGNQWRSLDAVSRRLAKMRDQYREQREQKRLST